MSTEHRDPLTRDPLPLLGRTILLTGVSRRAGIGYATACRLAAYGASVFCHHYRPHDQAQPWGADDLNAVLDGVRAHLVGDAHLADLHSDLSEAEAPENLIASAVAEFGNLDATKPSPDRMAHSANSPQPSWIGTGRSMLAPRSCWRRRSRSTMSQESQPQSCF